MIRIRLNIPKLFLDEQYERMQTLQSVGGNSGNCVFWHATRILLRSSNYIVDTLPIENISPAQIEHTDIIVIVLANSIQNSPSAVGYLNVLNNTLKVFGKPYVILSIGAQAPSNEPVQLNVSAHQAVRTIITGAAHTFLRGHYTHRTLVTNNIDTSQCTVMGCPSLTLLRTHFSVQYARLTQLPTTVDISNVRVCVCLPNQHQSDSLQLTWLRSVMLQAGKLPNVYTLIQDEGKGSTNTNSCYFVDPIKRTQFMKTMHFCIGTRIHGTIAGLLASVPSLCVTIDSRTSELCKTMHIPSVSAHIAKVFATHTRHIHPLKFLLSLLYRFYDTTILAAMFQHSNTQQQAYTTQLQKMIER